MAKGDHKPGFEQSLVELESLVEAMEKGDMSLEDALKAFERGIKLARQCGDTLKHAEQRVDLLTGKGANASLEPFHHDV